MRSGLVHDLLRAVPTGAAFAILCSLSIFGQSNADVAKTPIISLPRVTKVDIDGLKDLLRPEGKPRLINFWATWCDPCRDEFPDLVKLDSIYRGRIDFVTVSLDELSDIETFVPQFLAEMKSEMPAYLLKTDDDDAAIRAVSPDWSGNLPFTILLSENGSSLYVRKGKIRYQTVLTELEKSLGNVPVAAAMPIAAQKVPINESTLQVEKSPATKATVTVKKRLPYYTKFRRYSKRWWSERRKYLKRLHKRSNKK